MPAVTTTDTTTLGAIFSRAWEPTAMSAALAKHVLKLGFATADLERQRELMRKNSGGQLTAAEAAELENYVRVGDLIALLRSKARRTLGSAVRRSHA